MLRNYLITAFRNLKRNKVYSILNIAGLALGIGCALIVYKVVRFETSFDKHQTNFTSIYRVVTEDIHPDKVNKNMGTPHPVGPALQEELPEIKSVVRTNYSEDGQLNTTLENGQLKKFLIEDGIVFTEPDFFKIFSVEWLAGDQSKALTEPNTVVIARSEAQKLFGLKPGEESKAISKLINYNNVRDFRVIGIIEDPIQNLSLIHI